MTFDEVWVEKGSDDAAIWAAQHEFLMRQERYQFYRLGGLAGLVERTAAKFRSLGRLLQGIDADA